MQIGVFGAVPFNKERELLRAFCARVRELDPDVITGWSVVDFDFRVLERMARDWRVPFEIGRGRGTVRLRAARFPWASKKATIPGRVVLDGIHLLRGSFIQLDSYSFDNAARAILGEGKTLTGHDRAGQILCTFKNHRERFVEYNLTDARLVIDILDELRAADASTSCGPRTPRRARRLQQGTGQEHRRVHLDHAAPRRRRPQALAPSRPADLLRHDPQRRRACRRAQEPD